MSTFMLAEWMKAQKLKAPAMKSAPAFYRNLEEALDVRRRDHGLYTIKTNMWKDGDAVDFSSNDTLSLGASGALRAEFMQELERHPNVSPGAGSSRVMDGNYDYLEAVEDEIAQFHGADAGLMIGSGFEANLAIFAAIPRPGDAIVYDELVHASTHDGMQHSQAATRLPFRHNDVDSFRDALIFVCDSQPLIRQGKRCVIVAVESFYSMDGDICPLRELTEVTKEIFPGGNAQFLVDEAHSTGVIGPNGAGLVCELGLESEVAIRLHTFGKALSASGGTLNTTEILAKLIDINSAIAIILGNKTLKSALLNLARPVIYTTAPALSVVAAARAGYNLMKAGQTKSVSSVTSVILEHPISIILPPALNRPIANLRLLLGSRERPTSCQTLLQDDKFERNLGGSRGTRHPFRPAQRGLGRTAFFDPHRPHRNPPALQLLAGFSPALFWVLRLSRGIPSRSQGPESSPSGVSCQQHQISGRRVGCGDLRMGPGNDGD